MYNTPSYLFWHVWSPLVPDSGHDVHDHLGPVAVQLVAEDGAQQVGKVHLHEVAACCSWLHGDEGGRAAPRSGQDVGVDLDARYGRHIPLLHPILAVEGAMQDGLRRM